MSLRAPILCSTQRISPMGLLLTSVKNSLSVINHGGPLDIFKKLIKHIQSFDFLKILGIKNYRVKFTFWCTVLRVLFFLRLNFFEQF